MCSSVCTHAMQCFGRVLSSENLLWKENCFTSISFIYNTIEYVCLLSLELLLCNNSLEAWCLYTCSEVHSHYIFTPDWKSHHFILHPSIILLYLHPFWFHLFIYPSSTISVIAQQNGDMWHDELMYERTCMRGIILYAIFVYDSIQIYGFFISQENGERKRG